MPFILRQGVFERRMAALEGGVAAVAASCGHAAQFMAIAAIARAGDNIISSSFLSFKLILSPSLAIHCMAVARPLPLPDLNPLPLSLSFTPALCGVPDLVPGVTHFLFLNVSVPPSPPPPRLEWLQLLRAMKTKMWSICKIVGD